MSASMIDAAMYGGSFDPLHQGHKAIIQQALLTLDCQKLVVVPAWQNRLKNHSPHAHYTQRLDALKKFCSSLPHVDICEYELQQQRPVATIETLRYLNHCYHIRYCIIGADNLAHLHQWQEYSTLMKEVEFVIATRDNIVIPSTYKILSINEPISSTQMRSHAL